METQREKLLLQIASVQSELLQQLQWIHEMRKLKQEAMRKILKKCPYAKTVYMEKCGDSFYEYDGMIGRRMTFGHRVITFFVTFVSIYAGPLLFLLLLGKETYDKYCLAIIIGVPIAVFIITRSLFLSKETKEQRKIMKTADEKLDQYRMQIASSAVRISQKCAPLPVKYCYYYPMTVIYGYIRDLRADTLKEAINLFEAFLQQNRQTIEEVQYADETGNSAERVDITWR